MRLVAVQTNLSITIRTVYNFILVFMSHELELKRAGEACDSILKGLHQVNSLKLAHFFIKVIIVMSEFLILVIWTHDLVFLICLDFMM